MKKKKNLMSSLFSTFNSSLENTYKIYSKIEEEVIKSCTDPWQMCLLDGMCSRR